MSIQFQSVPQLLKIVFHNNLYQKAVLEASRKYKIKHYRIEKLKPCSIKNLIKKHGKKQKMLSLQQNNYAWAEGQLKVFVWLLVCYVYIKKICISDMNQQNFQFFSQFFQGYTIDFLHYQAKFLIKQNQKVTWSTTESKILNQIIKIKFQQKNWNTVAYQLYLISQKTVFRTPKQCRERWLNHEDPAKNHAQWHIQQDLELLRFIKFIGKKWSAISKSMKSTRTEHMIKNRYTSLIKKASRLYKGQTQSQILEQLMKLKKSQKIFFEESAMKQISLSTEKEIEAFQSQLELKDMQQKNCILEQCKKQDQHLQGFQDILPCNLIMDSSIEDQMPIILLSTQEIIDFFQKDNIYPTENFLEFFN